MPSPGLIWPDDQVQDKVSINRPSTGSLKIDLYLREPSVMRRVGPPVRPQMSDKWLARTDFCGVVTEKSTTIFLNKRDFGLQTLVGDFPERK
jgi:hypothetical protein